MILLDSVFAGQPMSRLGESNPRPTHYERVTCVAPGMKILRELQVYRLLPVAIVGC